jgi:hypothetical protein
VAGGFAAITVAIVVTTRPASAEDPFEIQVYDATANPPGVPGLELHLNDWLTGHRTSTPPEAPLHGQFHTTFEPSLGVTPIWEIGAYVQFALREDDRAFDWAGAKLRSKWVTPPGWDAHVRLGVNLEVSYLPSIYDRNRWGSEVRPIVVWQSREWLFALNPILDDALAGPDSSAGPYFEPAFKLARTVGPVAVGFETYSSFGPLSSPLAWREQFHQIFEVLDILSVPLWELEAGIGEGLTPSSAGLVVKAIVGYSFERTTEMAMRASNRNPP